MLKAYTVQEPHDGMGAIVFASRNIDARKWGAAQYNDGELGGLTVKRAPWADKYEGMGVPVREMVAEGWWFECWGCGRSIDEDGLFDDGMSVDGVIGLQKGPVYCCARCARKAISLKRREKAEEQRAIETYKAIVQKRFPDAEFCDDPHSGYRKGHHAYVVARKGGWHWQEVIISFRFPGMKIAPAQYRMSGKYRIGPDNAFYTCCAGDREAFEAYAARTRNA